MGEKYPGRGRDLEWLLGAAEPFGLDIWDRNAGGPFAPGEEQGDQRRGEGDVDEAAERPRRAASPNREARSGAARAPLARVIRARTDQKAKPFRKKRAIDGFMIRRASRSPFRRSSRRPP